MCGICGIYEYQSKVAVDPGLLTAMVGAMHHRGPDDDGIYLEEHFAIGMRRLSIIDLDGGKQPIENEDGSIVIVFNGEIYNYRELAEQLRQRGHQFKTVSDTEVIVHLYEELGEACVHQLRGMFTFAIWDKRRHRLLLTRDRLGIKPLYYTQQEGCLFFASEIKSLLQHSAVMARPNLTALSSYLSLRYVPAPQTLFEGVCALPPGHLLTCDAHGVKVCAYWDLSFAPQTSNKLDEEDAAEQLLELLRESVKLRLRSDVPFGAFLSGGVDSSLVVALMSEYLTEPVKTFSVGFESSDGQSDELPYARLVAQHFATDHHEVKIGFQDFMNLSEKVAWHLDQPIADQATVATYMLSQLAAKQVKMVLTGEGGDELFAGYARYAGEQFSPIFRHLPRPARTLALALSSQLPGLRRQKLALYALCQPDEVTRMINWFPLFNNSMKAALLTDAFKGVSQEITVNSVFAHQLSRSDATNPLHRMLYVDTKLWLPDYLLLRGDKLTMAASLEARVPLLDHKLVEFVASLPPQFKLNRRIHKYLLKKVSRAFLPAPILARKKEGFPIPIAAWFRHELRSFIRDFLTPATLQKRGLFEVSYVNKLLQEHETGFADHSTLLWGLVSVEIWYRCFIDANGANRT